MSSDEVRAVVGKELARDGNDSVWLVAEDESGEVVATCTVTRLAHRMCRHRADLGGFVIAPRMQGSGLARRIVDAAREEAQQWGCSILEISCRGGTHAENAYKGLGFVEWGRLNGGYEDFDEVYDQVHLAMRIDPR